MPEPASAQHCPLLVLGCLMPPCSGQKHLTCKLQLGCLKKLIVRETEKYNSFKTLLVRLLFLTEQVQKVRKYKPTSLSSGLSYSHYHISLEADASFSLISTIIDDVRYFHTWNIPKQLLFKTAVCYPLSNLSNRGSSYVWPYVRLTSYVQFSLTSRSFYSIIFNTVMKFPLYPDCSHFETAN